MTPDVYISFSQPCCRFLQLLRFSASFNLFGPADTVGFTPSCLEAILMDLRVFCLVWLWPRFVSFRCFFAGETQIWPGDLRVVAVARVLFLC